MHISSLIHIHPQSLCLNPLLIFPVKYTLATSVSFHSYMDTEQYEDAVRDYEKVYQTEKTKGECIGILFVCISFP